MKDENISIYEIIQLILRKKLQILFLTSLFIIITYGYFHYYQSYNSIKIYLNKNNSEDLNVFNQFNSLINLSKVEQQTEVPNNSSISKIDNKITVSNNSLFNEQEEFTPKKLLEMFLEIFNQYDVSARVVKNILFSESALEENNETSAFNYSRKFKINKNDSDDYFITFNSKNITNDLSILDKIIKEINISVKEKIIYNIDYFNYVLDQHKINIVNRLRYISNIEKQIVDYRSELGLKKTIEQYEISKFDYKEEKDKYNFNFNYMSPIYFEGKEVLKKKIELLEEQMNTGSEILSEDIVLLNLLIDNIEKELSFKYEVLNELSSSLINDKKFEAVKINLNYIIKKKSFNPSSLFILLFFIGLTFAIISIVIHHGFTRFKSERINN